MVPAALSVRGTGERERLLTRLLVTLLWCHMHSLKVVPVGPRTAVVCVLLAAATATPRVEAAPAPQEDARVQALRAELKGLEATANASGAADDLMRVVAKRAELLALLPENPERHEGRFFHCDQAYFAFQEAVKKQPEVRAHYVAIRELLVAYLESLTQAYAADAPSREHWKDARGWLVDVDAKLAALPKPLDAGPTEPPREPPREPDRVEGPQPDTRPVENKGPVDEPPKPAPRRWPVAGLATSAIVLGGAAAALGGLAAANARLREQAAGTPPGDEFKRLTALHERYDGAGIAMIVVGSLALVSTTTFAVLFARSRKARTGAPTVGWIPGGALLGATVRLR